MVRWTLYDTLAFLLLLSLLLPSLLIMFIPSTFKRPVSSWKALNLRKTLLMASSVRLKPLNCSRLPCVYAQETLTFLLRSEERFSRNDETDLVCRLLLEKKNVATGADRRDEPQAGSGVNDETAEHDAAMADAVGQVAGGVMGQNARGEERRHHDAHQPQR